MPGRPACHRGPAAIIRPGAGRDFGRTKLGALPKTSVPAHRTANLGTPTPTSPSLATSTPEERGHLRLGPPAPSGRGAEYLVPGLASTRAVGAARGVAAGGPRFHKSITISGPTGHRVPRHLGMTASGTVLRLSNRYDLASEFVRQVLAAGFRVETAPLPVPCPGHPGPAPARGLRPVPDGAPRRPGAR